MNIATQTNEMDQMIVSGQIVEAVKTFFADTATTSDYNNVKTSNKAEMVEKMEGFLGAISEVNEISHHKTWVDGNSSLSEFTFHFDMKDGMKIYWHEIIKREWANGEVIHESYFNS